MVVQVSVFKHLLFTVFLLTLTLCYPQKNRLLEMLDSTAKSADAPPSKVGPTDTGQCVPSGVSGPPLLSWC